MFGFLKKRMLFENYKAIVQNLSIIPSLQGYYDNDDEILQLLANYKTRNLDYSNALIENKELHPDALIQVMNDNRELRCLYDKTAMKSLNSFDKVCTPLMGWKKHYEEYMR